MARMNVGDLSDKQLLAVYGAAKTKALLHMLFKMPPIPTEAVKLIRRVSEEISERGLDQGSPHATN